MNFTSSNPSSMDRLSSLPEAILCHILSFLPTKASAATSVLSKRWQHLWTSVAVLDFHVFRDTPLPRENEQYESLVRLAYELISLPRKLPIKIFRLSYLSLNPLLRDWVAGAEELELGGMPSFLFDQSSAFMNLKVLRLSDFIDLDFAESGLFPKLRVLHLYSVFFEEAEGGSLVNLLAACPVLEELLWLKTREDDGKFKICVPTLTSLVVRTDLETVERYRYDYVFVLETPALEYLSFSCHCYEERLEAANLSKLRKADIDCYVLKEKRYDVSYGSCVIDLLSMLSSVEFLKLSCDPVGISTETGLSYVHGLVHGFDYPCLDKLPVFHNLVRLEICIPSCDCVLLPHLLLKFHNLQHIAITKKLDTEVAEACWNEPLQVPICLSSTLLSFSFQGFEGFEVEMKLVQYVLKHAMVLKNVTVDTSPYVKAVMARVGAMQRLPMDLRGSKACQVHLTT